jgi:aspartyl-tRNA(Asn)/glutamyl-tRNA(Gln) amidotransferase subunit C
MAVDKETVRKVARLARLAVPEDRLEPMTRELNGILKWVEQLQEIDTADVPAMTSVVTMKLKMREDKVTDGGYAADLMRNAPDGEDNFFTVPKVVE